MRDEIDNYLKKVDRYLKPIVKSEREDIILEIKSEIFELESSGNTHEAIIARLGNPKTLAKAYIEEELSKNNNKVISNILPLIAYVLIVGFGGVFVLPFTVISGVTFFISGIICPVAGIVKFVAYLMGIDIQNIEFTIGSYSANAIELLPISFIMGALLIGASYLMWKITFSRVKYMMRK